jgi:RNA polymerase sigma factor (TIGR02999 family)
MSEITRILNAIEAGQPQAAAQLLPLVYDELRQVAAQKLAQEKPGHTLVATALVHEAYLRLVGGAEPGAAGDWANRRHFFAAAAEAMRRILIESARRKQRMKHGGSRKRLDLESLELPAEEADDNIQALDEALERLASENIIVAQVVKLRYFAGLTIEDTASALGLSVRTANRHWAYAKAWLYQQLNSSEESTS